jgi:hypothetical protein
MKNLALTMSLVLAAITGLFGCATHDHSGHTHAAAGKAYPLKTCIVTDEELDKDAYVFVHEGQEIKLCCKPCREDFDKEPAKYLKKLAAK